MWSLENEYALHRREMPAFQGNYFWGILEWSKKGEGKIAIVGLTPSVTDSLTYAELFVFSPPQNENPSESNVKYQKLVKNMGERVLFYAQIDDSPYKKITGKFLRLPKLKKK